MYGETKMKKLIVCLTFTLTLLLCAGFLSAQSGKQLLNQIGRTPVKTVKPKGEMRIFQKDGEDVITNFPSAYLVTAPKVHIILPSENTGRKPSIYIVSQEELDKAKVEEMYPQIFGKYFVITIKLEEGENNFTKFLTAEFLPYVEINYFVSSNAEEKTLVVKNSFALAYLADLKNISAYLKNAILGFDYSSPLPKIEMAENLNLWAYGPLDNMAALHTSLAKNNLVYLKDFAYNITKGGDDINFDFLFNKEGRKISKITPYQQFKTLDLSKDFASEFWLNLTAKAGYNLAYIPQKVRVAPPFLDWNKEQAAFSIISGATAGKIKVDGKTEFGKKFKAKFNLIDSENQPK